MLEEKDIERIKKIIDDRLQQSLDVEILGPLTDLISAFEAGIASFKHQLKENKGIREKESYDLEKIVWQLAQGSAGPYEKSGDANNPHFQALLNDLATHNNKLTKDGFFVWLFPNGQIVGRKKRNRKY